MNQIYKKNEYIVIPVQNNFIVINTEKVFKEGHTHVKSIGFARLLIDLAIERKLPDNPHIINSIIRITKDKDYIDKLKEFKEESTLNFEEMMQGEHVYKRNKGAYKQIK